MDDFTKEKSKKMKIFLFRVRGSKLKISYFIVFSDPKSVLAQIITFFKKADFHVFRALQISQNPEIYKILGKYIKYLKTA